MPWPRPGFNRGPCKRPAFLHRANVAYPCRWTHVASRPGTSRCALWASLAAGREFCPWTVVQAVQGGIAALFWLPSKLATAACPVTASPPELTPRPPLLRQAALRARQARPVQASQVPGLGIGSCFCARISESTERTITSAITASISGMPIRMKIRMKLTIEPTSPIQKVLIRYS